MNKIILMFTLLIISITSASAFNAKNMFRNKCSKCHTIGDGNDVGPDLAVVLFEHKHSDDWLVKFIQYPEGMIKGDLDEGYKKDQHAGEIFTQFRDKLMPESDFEKKEILSILSYVRKVAENKYKKMGKKIPKK